MSTKSFDELFADLPNGWLREGEARLLLKTAQDTEGTILEVGSFLGRSTVLLASLSRPMICVDPWDDHFDSDRKGEETYQSFLENLRSRGITNVQPFRGYIEGWLPQSCGFCYLDGDHTPQGTRAQILRAAFCKPTKIAIHDVNDGGEGLYIKRVALDMLGQWDERVDRLAVWSITNGQNNTRRS